MPSSAIPSLLLAAAPVTTDYTAMPRDWLMLAMASDLVVFKLPDRKRVSVRMVPRQMEDEPVAEAMDKARAGGAMMVTVAGPGPVPVRLQINRSVYHLSLDPRRSLLDALRLDLGLTGTKRVCNLGECGACTVLLDGRPIDACITLALECEGHEITTIEGLAADGRLDPVQEAFIRFDAVQCGFCTPGQVLAAKALLARNPRPSDEEIRHAMAGNLCRCGTYTNIVQAIRSLASTHDPNPSRSLDPAAPDTRPLAARPSGAPDQPGQTSRRPRGRWRPPKDTPRPG